MGVYSADGRFLRIKSLYVGKQMAMYFREQPSLPKIQYKIGQILMFGFGHISRTRLIFKEEVIFAEITEHYIHGLAQLLGILFDPTQGKTLVSS